MFSLRLIIFSPSVSSFCSNSGEKYGMKELSWGGREIHCGGLLPSRGQNEVHLTSVPGDLPEPKPDLKITVRGQRPAEVKVGSWGEVWENLNSMRLCKNSPRYSAQNSWILASQWRQLGPAPLIPGASRRPNVQDFHAEPAELLTLQVPRGKHSETEQLFRPGFNSLLCCRLAGPLWQRAWLLSSPFVLLYQVSQGQRNWHRGLDHFLL